MPKTIHSTQPPLKFIPQRLNLLILQIVRWLLPIALRFRTRPWLPAGIVSIEGKNVEVLAELYQQFQAGKIRFLLAFRHPEVEDPLCMLYLLSYIVPRVARQKGITLRSLIHSYFLYDRGMTVWAGNWLGWLFSRLGGVPVHRGRRLDRQAIQTARELFANGKVPIAVAPEGGTNGHSGIVSPLEPGVAQISFWCAEDLHKANRTETVIVVPIAIQYHYVDPPWSKLDWLLSKLEADSGLEVKEIDSGNQEEIYYQRLFRLAEYLITEMEEFYRRFYHQDIPKTISSDESASPNQVLIARLHRLLDKALEVTEQYFGVQAQGNFIDRCRRLEEAGWNYIYREDLADINALPPFKRGLADWIAEEADLRMRHMRIVESFVAVTATYIQEQPTAERFAETALLVFDMLSRIQDTTLPGRPRLGLRQAQITVGEPISVTERWSNSQGDRQMSRQAVSNLTKDLQIALEKMIC
ncbi:MAG: lysophospholipid acyltransferase family protein [Nostoc sp. DedVER02]|uniref:lysophospholipid acyltransferase family protein n=1 Tax=unclassified Nostoc TaxID=2593658 RepID=UPI002AD1F474|nr:MULTISPECIES: 1-acyl-sn-glycerol-3-phosphate acyltransferase [unclassified Nostoc]MDZ7985280.1 1-acyl-sn-glycerol-3-phosphate acyltransferase [Nostoc sp. DedVER02]MDZ8115218.1 1-acyl-sn-glycerol-3-phosphate acyltransferase [Nostoc sp. DedVER01b]